MHKFATIPKMTRAHYAVDITWDYIEDWLKANPDFDLDPDFQRAHVWTRAQQTAYIEWCLRGGESGRDLTFNYPGWPNAFGGGGVIVDGKQRLQAVRAFLKDDVPAFGCPFSSYTDRLGWEQNLRFRIGNLTSRAEVLRWYLDFNAGGTQHTAEEIERVRRLLAAESENRPPVLGQAGA